MIAYAVNVDGVFLYHNALVQLCDIHQNAGLLSPKSRSLSERTSA